MKIKGKPIPYRRKLQGKTNYKKRMILLGSKKVRLVVRRSINNFVAQLVDYKNKGDIVLVSANSYSLKKLGWKAHRGNTPTAYLTGLLLGKKAKDKGIKEAILDLGLHNSIEKNSLYAVLKGVIDSGIEVNHGNNIFPSEDRIQGKHIVEFMRKNENKLQFSRYEKSNLNYENFIEHFNQIKNKILT